MTRNLAPLGNSVSERLDYLAHYFGGFIGTGAEISPEAMKSLYEILSLTAEDARELEQSAKGEEPAPEDDGWLADNIVLFPGVSSPSFGDGR